MSPARLIAGLCLIFTLFSPGLAFAQDASPTPEPSTSPTISSTSNSGEALNSSNYRAPQNADYAVMNLMHAALCQLAGVSPTGDNCLANVKGADGTTSLLSFSKVPGGGAIGAMGSMVASLYTKPLSSTQYLAEVGQNIGIVRPAYAQSVLNSSGGQVIRPVLDLWRFTQRLAYIAFVIVFLLVGFMIMLRRKMNPQTVVTIQSALPGLVVGLIMVTFSYFIAAAIVDLSFVGVQIVAGIFADQPNSFGGTSDRNFDATTNRQNLQTLANSSNVFDFLGYTVRQSGDAKAAIDTGIGRFNEASGGAATAIFTVLGAVVGIFMGFLAGPWGAAIGGAVGAGGGAALGGQIVSFIVPLILIIALSIQIFRLMFALINAYIQILVATIFGPVYILMASVPGQGKRMSDWLRGLLANALIFPAVFAVFLFAGSMLALTNPEIWSNAPPLFGNLPTDLIRVLVAYGALLAVPTVPDMVRGAFGIKGGDNFGKAALGGFMAGFGVARASTPFLGQSAVNAIYTSTNSATSGIRNTIATGIFNRYTGEKWFNRRHITPGGAGTRP